MNAELVAELERLRAKGEREIRNAIASRPNLYQHEYLHGYVRGMTLTWERIDAAIARAKEAERERA